jgi:hypothetical protein
VHCAAKLSRLEAGGWGSRAQDGWPLKIVIKIIVNPTFRQVRMIAMDQISIKTPNPKCRLFLKIDQERYLAVGVYLSETPDPPTHCYTLYEYMYPCTVLIHTGQAGGGGGR